MPDFDLDSALNVQDTGVPVCDDCRQPMTLIGMEVDDYFGRASAIFRCVPCEEATTCVAYRGVQTRWCGSMWVEGGIPHDRRPDGDFFGCPCCDTDEDSFNLSLDLVDGRVHSKQQCEACLATWTDVFALEVNRA